MWLALSCLVGKHCFNDRLGRTGDSRRPLREAALKQLVSLPTRRPVASCLQLSQADAGRLATALTAIRTRGLGDFYDRLSRLARRFDCEFTLVTERVGSAVFVTSLGVDDPGGAETFDKATINGAQVTFTVDRRTRVVDALRVRPTSEAGSASGTSRVTRSNSAADAASEKDAGATVHLAH